MGPEWVQMGPKWVPNGSHDGLEGSRDVLGEVLSVLGGSWGVLCGSLVAVADIEMLLLLLFANDAGSGAGVVAAGHNCCDVAARGRME